MDEHEEDEDPKTLEDFVDTIVGGIVAIAFTIISCLVITSYFENIFDFIRELLQ